MTVADLCVGLFITPFAVFSTFSNTWIFNDKIFCHIEAYLLAIFFIGFCGPASIEHIYTSL
jgi:hypothetical protein